MPHASTFPFTSMTLETASFGRAGKKLTVSAADMAVALQYSNTAGLPELVKFLLALQQDQHGVTDREICVTNGSQDAIAKAMDMLIEPGDSVLVESPTYSGTLAILKPMECNIIDVETDEHGIIPDKLESVLESWQVDVAKPKFLYTIPVASNPTGASCTLERKTKIYGIARKHDLLILEDDPYYYLQFSESRTPSYMSMDTDGRVLRFDSFSKILSSGMRLGFTTGPKELVDRIILHAQASHLHPNGVAQMMAIVLMREWGVEGFLKHTELVTEFYRKRRDLFVTLAKKYLDGLVEYSLPAGGMFFWMRLLGVSDSKSLIKERAIEKKVLLLPGAEFLPNGGVSSFVRASFSTASPEQMEEAIKRLSLLLISERK